MKRIALLLALLVTSCAQATPSQGSIQTAIAQTSAAQSRSSVTQAPAEKSPPTSTSSARPTNTSRLTSTPAPTDTPTPQTVADIDKTRAFAKNYVGSQDSGGVVIEIARILIAEKSAVGEDFSRAKIFDDKPVVVEFVFKVTNNTDKTVSVYTDQGLVAINNEQIDLFDYSMSGASFGDDVGGDFLPGVTAIGGLYVGLKRTPYVQVNKITIRIDGPRDQDFNRLGPDYAFDIEVKDWTFEEMPDELK